MSFSPQSQQEVAELLKAANAAVRPAEAFDFTKLNRLVEYAPEDMTATVEAGVSLAEFQEVLNRHKQWLPIDPPSGTISIGELLDQNLSGPRRLGYGTIRDYLIGIKVALPTGEIIKAGGKVVKNVAGYDLCKLFVGSRQTLGVILEATFKLRPLPEKEIFLLRRNLNSLQLGGLGKTIRVARIDPVVLDVFRSTTDNCINGVIAFAGTTEDVDAQEAAACQLGFAESGSLDYDKQFWSAIPTAKKISVLPSQTASVLEKIEGPFVSRFANGIVYHRSAVQLPTTAAPHTLMARVKSVFDPNGVLPEYQP